LISIFRRQMDVWRLVTFSIINGVEVRNEQKFFPSNNMIVVWQSKSKQGMGRGKMGKDRNREKRKKGGKKARKENKLILMEQAKTDGKGSPL